MVNTRSRHYADNTCSKTRIRASKTQQTKRVKNLSSPSPWSSSSFECGDKHRDHVRETLVTALSKVADEVGEDMRDEVKGCDVHRVAASIETALFEKLGLFKPLESPRLLKEVPFRMRYRCFLFACSDKPDLRRKLLLRQLSPHELITSRKLSEL